MNVKILALIVGAGAMLSACNSDAPANLQLSELSNTNPSHIVLTTDSEGEYVIETDGNAGEITVKSQIPVSLDANGNIVAASRHNGDRGHNGGNDHNGDRGHNGGNDHNGNKHDNGNHDNGNHDNGQHNGNCPDSLHNGGNCNGQHNGNHFGQHNGNCTDSLCTNPAHYTMGIGRFISSEGGFTVTAVDRYTLRINFSRVIGAGNFTLGKHIRIVRR